MTRFLSVCSGIEAASVAFRTLGWEAVAFAEIEPFPCQVLAHHYPQVPNLGDLTRFREWPTHLLEHADILCGGTPCQAFSVAGLRGSLDDERGNLTLTFVHLYDYLDTLRKLAGRPPAVCIWENVPGIFSDKQNAFGCFLAGLVGEAVPIQPAGGKWTHAGAVCGPQRTAAWRVLDAQYHGLAQRRQRVIVVASADPAFDPAAVLFEWGGLRRDTPPSREPGQSTATALSARAKGGGGLGFKPRHYRTARKDGAAAEIAGPLTANTEHAGDCSPHVAYTLHGTREGTREVATQTDLAGTIREGTGSAIQNSSNTVIQNWAVRRLTCEECELLQGFPIGYTLLPGKGKRKGEDLQQTTDYLIALGFTPADAAVLAHCPDGPRYKALGNSWAVPVFTWVGARVDRMLNLQPLS